MAGRLAAGSGWLKGLLSAELSQLSRGQAKVAYLLRLVVETWRELRRDQCFVHASSLAYKSLLSLVPFIVLALTLSSGPIFERYQEPILNSIVEQVYPVREESIQAYHAANPGEKPEMQSADEVRRFLDGSRQALKDRMRLFTAREGSSGGIISLAFLAIIVAFLMWDIEFAFNHIWGVASGRPLVSKIATYTATLFWGPLFLLLSVSITAWAKSEAALLSGSFEPGAFDGWAYEVLVRRAAAGFLLPAFFLWLMLLGLYVLMPNTRVRKRPAVTGAALAALLLQAARWAFEYYIVNYVAYDRIYGTLSVVPVTLIWLYTSWVVVLFGAEVAFTIQNFDDLAAKEERERRGIRLRLYFAVRTVYTVCRRFMLGESPKVLDELAREFQIAEYALRSVVKELIDHGILARVEGETDAFVPARSPETLTVKHVVDALHGGVRAEAPSVSGTMLIDRDPVRDVIHELFRRYERAAEEQLGSLSFADLARSVQTRADRTGRGPSSGEAGGCDPPGPPGRAPAPEAKEAGDAPPPSLRLEPPESAEPPAGPPRPPRPDAP